MFYEIRRYQSRPGHRAEWIRYFQTSAGMSVTASFADEQDEDGCSGTGRGRAGRGRSLGRPAWRHRPGRGPGRGR
jgi:hypothetical protein